MSYQHQELRVLAVSAVAIFPMTGATIASVQLLPQGSALGTATFRPVWSNCPGGPWSPFPAALLSDTTLGPGADVIDWINVTGKQLLGIEVVTAEGADETVDIYVSSDAP